MGASYQKADSELRASVQGLPELGLKLDDLGIDDTDTSWALEYRWRFAEKWMFVGMAYTFEQSGGLRTKRDFNFGGVEFEAGASVDTSIEVDTYILDVLYSVYKTDRSEIMLGGGLHVLDLATEIKARAFVGDQERRGGAGVDDILAPLPNLRMQGFYAINDKWGLGVNLGWLSANYDDYEGSFAYVHARANYAFGERLSASLGYQYTDFELEREKSRTESSEYNVQFNGPTAALTYRF